MGDVASSTTRELTELENVEQITQIDVNHVTQGYNEIESHVVENTVFSTRVRPTSLALSPVPGDISVSNHPSPAPYVSVMTMRGDSPRRRASPAIGMSPKTSPKIFPKTSRRMSPKISPINRNSPFPKLTTELSRELRKSQRKVRKAKDEVTPPPPIPPSSLTYPSPSHTSTPQEALTQQDHELCGTTKQDSTTNDHNTDKELKGTDINISETKFVKN